MIFVKPLSFHTKQLKADKGNADHEQNFHSLESYLDLAYEAMKKEDYASAIHFLCIAVELSPEDSRPIREMAKIDIVNKQWNEAMKCIEYLLFLDPHDEDTISAKQLVMNKIEYQKMISSFPIYS